MENNDLALLYARVSTSVQASDGISLDAQERDLIRAAESAGFTNYEMVREEGRSGKSISGRPAIKNALARLQSGEASALFVTRIDRLARSTRDFLSIVDHSEKYSWRLVLLDLNLDTSHYSSRFVVTIMSALAEMERAIIAERQKDVHRDRREKGIVWGVDKGPKRLISDKTIQKIDDLRATGLAYHKIAQKLNAEGEKTPFGKEWYASSVRRAHLLENKSTGPGELPVSHEQLDPDPE
jgi:site-specific DNA recombinase